MVCNLRQQLFFALYISNFLIISMEFLFVTITIISFNIEYPQTKHKFPFQVHIYFKQQIIILHSIVDKYIVYKDGVIVVRFLLLPQQM
jgi:hypothetical protein